MYGPALTQQTLLQKARFRDRAFSFYGFHEWKTKQFAVSN